MSAAEESDEIDSYVGGQYGEPAPSHENVREIPRTAPAVKKRKITRASAVTPKPQSSASSSRLRKFTDSGNAERLVDQHGADLRFVPGFGWHVWDGRRWQRDETGEVHRRGKQTIRAMYGEAERADDSALRKAIGDWARKSEARDRRSSMVALAQTEAQIVARAEELDADAWAFNIANGTLDLRTGTLRPHRRADLITKVSSVTYDPTARCPTWEAFLARSLPDAEVRTFLQRFAGYSLTASAREHCLAFLHGPGGNGKGVFLLTLRSVLGDYAAKAPRGLLTATRGGDKHPTELMTLRGARLVWCSEVNETDVWDEAKVKDLASEDPITAHFMRCDDVTFMPTHKLWIAGNHRPRVRGSDDGIWRRLRLVPFDVTITEAEKDPELTTKLLEELPGILAWAARGCLDWQKHGLGTPAAVKVATTAYRDSENTIGRFVADACRVGTEEAVRTSDLYKAFVAWCEDEGEGKAVSQKRFGGELSRGGFTPGREKDGRRERVWKGLRLLKCGEVPDDEETDLDPDGGSRSRLIHEFQHEQSCNTHEGAYTESRGSDPDRGSDGELAKASPVLQKWAHDRARGMA